MATSAPVADFEVPGHRLVRPLGRGGMATVYLAIQASLSRPVAVKILQAPTDETITRFEQEARTIARLQHPHIIAIYEVGRTSDGQLYYTMPYLPNGDLSRLDLRDSPARIAAVIRALAGALGHAHQHGIVHRDVKPENVLFDQHRRALLTDFGIARASDNLRVTRQGATMGSSGYMSPEQARGLEIDGRSDLYSLGVVCYELLTGDLPFHGTDALSTALAHLEQPIPRLPPMKRAWQPFLDKALAKSPADRFQNAQEMIDALDGITGRHKSEGAPSAGLFDRLREKADTSTLLRFGIPVLAVIVLAIVAAVLWRGHAGSRPQVPAATSPPKIVAAPPQAAASAPARTVVAANQPAPAPVSAASAIQAENSAAVVAARITVLLAHANALFAQNKLISPKSDNAADTYLAVLALQPDNPAAHAGVDRVLAKVQKDIDAAWKRRQIDRVRMLVKRTDALAASADPESQKTWHDARAQLASDVGSAAADAVHAHKQERVDDLRELAETLPATYPAGFDPKLMDAPPPPPPLHAGSLLRDDGGPQLVYVPADDGKSPAFAIGRTEVTRAEYEQFVHATGRAPAHCVEANNPFSGMHGWKWSDPGFPQDANHPVVCVSWNDAAAYAAWLSHRTGQEYRLPNDTEWLRAAAGGGDGSPCARGNVDDVSRKSAFDNDRLKCNDGAAETAPVGHYEPSAVGAYDMYGNVSEWLTGGAPGSRAFRGLSGRDGSQQSALKRRATAASDVGYTNIGFRVLRVIDPQHPPPQK
ncbi:MAG TPA: bifunctional serine/threonine-protein kinase/formylglycine-generating enzyme family protein [Rhodanobacteraceae bacterium]|nr:bifunctional serine/threonine-protein kinase/formylglycine-generating enzyme family protein [Rhodanobacteraceae bacterium]